MFPACDRVGCPGQRRQIVQLQRAHPFRTVQSLAGEGFLKRVCDGEDKSGSLRAPARAARPAGRMSPNRNARPGRGDSTGGRGGSSSTLPARSQRPATPTARSLQTGRPPHPLPRQTPHRGNRCGTDCQSAVFPARSATAPRQAGNRRPGRATHMAKTKGSPVHSIHCSPRSQMNSNFPFGGRIPRSPISRTASAEQSSSDAPTRSGSISGSQPEPLFEEDAGKNRAGP